jgi:ubiquinone/menaquinone biosynthesis C-methylase UbiE
MKPHVCPWWGGYFIDNRLRRLLHNPERILGPYIGSCMTVMDVGCGMGLFTIAMARLVGPGGRVIAVDLQQRMLDVLRKRATEADVGDRIDAHRCQTNALEMSEPVDFALAFYSAHEVPDLSRLLSEIHGCLRPRGRFLVVEPIGHVSATDFQNLLSMAGDVGLVLHDQPRIRLSRAAVLVKEQTT